MLSQRFKMEEFQALTQFEDIMKEVNKVFVAVPRLNAGYLSALEALDEFRRKLNDEMAEKEKVTKQLSNSLAIITDLELQVRKARQFLDEEKLEKKRAIRQRDFFSQQLDDVRKVLYEGDRMYDDAVERLSTLRKRLSSTLPQSEKVLETIAEGDTTCSLSDLSCTRDEEEIEESLSPVEVRKRPLSTEVKDTKRRKTTTFKSLELQNGGKVVATTTVTVEHRGLVANGSTSQFRNENAPPSGSEESDGIDGPMSRASSDVLLTPFSMNSINTRPHTFHQKAMIKGENCNFCGKRLGFSATGVKCRDCKSVAHFKCKDKVPLPCVPVGSTPSKSSKDGGTIADYTPLNPPMVPSLVIHCVKEIEARGLNEVGLYRIPGSDKEVKSLKEKFLKGKGAPNLSEVCDIHTICGCLKEFLRSLREPLITQIRWDEFVRAANLKELEDRRARLFQIVSELPQPNRDTLAYILLHLQRIAEVPETKMPADNLAKTFGPTLIGYSRNDPSNPLGETNDGIQVMRELISLPSEYYESFMREASENGKQQEDLRKTPSSRSLPIRDLFPITTPEHKTPSVVRRLRSGKRYFDDDC